MKFPHAAALALVGWCLAIPPFDYTVPVQAEAPTTRWTLRCTFTTAAACEEQRQKWIDMRTKMAKPGKDRLVRIMKASRCIASDESQRQSKKAHPDVSDDHAPPK